MQSRTRQLTETAMARDAARLAKRDYTVAVIRSNGCTISTQLWDVENSDEPLRTVLEWWKRDAATMPRQCPVVLAPVGGDTVFMTVGEVLDFFEK